MQIDKYDAMSIRERCESLVPSLANANIVRQAVGLRPYRSSVRVECELIKDVHGNWLRCIHHYGHGGYGVTASPGRLEKSSFTILSYLLRTHSFPHSFQVQPHMRYNYCKSLGKVGPNFNEYLLFFDLK